MEAAIEIRRLRLRARHGVLDQERVCGNVFEVSAVLTVDYDGSDCLESTVSYADVVETIKREMAEPSALLELCGLPYRSGCVSGVSACKQGCGHGGQAPSAHVGRDGSCRRHCECHRPLNSIWKGQLTSPSVNAMIRHHAAVSDARLAPSSLPSM